MSFWGFFWHEINDLLATFVTQEFAINFINLKNLLIKVVSPYKGSYHDIAFKRRGY